MKTIKVSELTVAALDWAVATCEGLPLKLDPMGFRKDAPTSIQAGWWVWDGEGQNQVIGHRKTSRYQEEGYSPSTDWAQGGPIIEREMIQLTPHCMVNPLHGWAAAYRSFDEDDDVYALHRMRGKTPLIAAMRCYVASKLGDTVKIPEELL